MSEPQHAKYGGSTIKRTFECPGWVSFCEPLPKQGSSEYADRGTLLHMAMQKIYEGDDDFDDRSVIGMSYEGIVLTEELYIEKIIPAVASVEQIFDQFNVVELICEARVEIDEEIFGTADLLARGSVRVYEDHEDPDDSETGELLNVAICLDYKFGDGILVGAEENEQGLFYATAGSITPATEHIFKDADVVAIAIVQPNDRGMEDFTLWEQDAVVLVQELKEILDAVEESKKDNPEFASGDHCRFCMGRGLCPATSGEVSAMARIDSTAPDLLKSLPTFDQLSQAEDTIKAIRALVHSQLEEGVEIEGFKLVAKRANRSYSNEAAVQDIVRRSKKIKREEAYTDIFKTPAKLEKMCKSKGLDFDALFGAFVQKVSSGTTLASSEDPREAAPGRAALQKLLDRD